MVILLALGGCDAQPKAQPSEPPRAAPHFQMVSTTDGVYVLDTVSGQVAKCMTTVSEETWCTPPVAVNEGKGPPAWIKAAH